MQNLMLSLWASNYVADITQGGTIKTSMNLPAQSFYQSRKTLLDLCDRAGIKQVIFYCGEFGSCLDRGGVEGDADEME